LGCVFEAGSSLVHFPAGGTTPQTNLKFSHLVESHSPDTGKKNRKKKHVLRIFPNVTSWGSCGDRVFLNSELHGPIRLTLIEQ
jgi:hypothetical protein